MLVVWLFGPPGVGKSTIGWALYRSWSAERGRTGYVDIDQLGMLYPTPDPRNHAVKAGNLAAVLRSFAAAGISRTIVSGVADPDEVADFAAQGDGAYWVWCELSASPQEVRDRLVLHRDQPGMVDDAAAHARLLESEGTADLRIDTTGRTVDQVVDSLRRALESRSSGMRSLIRPASDDDASPGATRDARFVAIALTGTRAVGKSTVAWEVFQRVQQEGRVAAYVDLEQVGFVGTAAPATTTGVRIANAAAMAEVYSAAGAEIVVLSGPIDDHEELAAYAAALAPATLTVARLHADEPSLRGRVAHRAVQRVLHLPGDDLRALPPGEQDEVVRRSLHRAADLDAIGVGHPVDTAGRTIEQIADDVLALLRPSPRHDDPTAKRPFDELRDRDPDRYGR